MRRPEHILLVACILAVAVAVSPLIGSATATDGIDTNETVLNAGIQGTTATNVSIPADSDDRSEVRSTVATELGVEERVVRVDSPNSVVEIRARNVSTSALRGALTAAGLDADSAAVRERATESTQREVVSTLETRFSDAGIDATVTPVTTAAGDRGIVITTTDANRTEVVDTATFQGRVELVARFPVQENGSETYRRVTLLTNDDFTRIGSAQPPRAGQPPRVPATLTDNAAGDFSTAMQKFGFTSAAGTANCDTQTAVQDTENASGYCLLTVRDGDVVYAAQMSAGLADTITSGEFVENPAFVITASNMSAAEQLSLALQSGAIPSPLAFDALPESATEDVTDDTTVESDDEPTTATGPDDRGTTEPSSPTESSESGPGFTVLGALVAIIALGAGRALRQH